ncbi:MAG: UDP-N-acetylglucosamine 1-carboxyvinyltransferase [Eubacteriales bacterium]|nr:UDP-N-acetylglucosamine 1-carboxyvinyltransferase [Eubacteriales bacterium]
MPNSDRFLITGGRPLTGDVLISGGKNTAVAIIPAVLLCDEPCIIENVPCIDDVIVLTEILEYIGAKTEFLPNNKLYVDPTKVNKTEIPTSLSGKLRASYYFIGALLGKYNEAKISSIGGCEIGGRPIDQHIKGFQALGVEICEDETGLSAKTAKLIPNDIYFDCVSVGATINILLTAVMAEGTTVIHNAAKEPHIVDLANFLNSMGAVIRGAGTDTIKIRGGNKLHATNYAIIPDQIETGTMMIAAAATHGDVYIHGCIPTHMESLTAKLLEIGVRIQEFDDCIHVSPLSKHRAVNFTTQVYPGFPTDLQQPMTALLTQCNGISKVNETIYETRYNHVPYLESMGAITSQNGRILTITGVQELRGAHVKASDLRAGAALVIAGLMAKGVTEISDIHYIDRGYDHLEIKLKNLGADIQRIKVHE